MKLFVSLFTTLLYFSCFSQSGSLLSEDFTTYNGTSATTPAGWYFSSHGIYSTSTYSGASGPNSYRFGVNNAFIVSPSFQNADSVRFWLKGAGTDSLSYLLIEESPDSVSWATVDTIRPVSLSATVFHFPITQTSIHLRFTYFKSVGNAAFDDLEIFSTPDNPAGRIITYFTRPVDTTVGFPPHAIQLNQIVDDTLIAYIDRAQTSLDIALYNYVNSTNLSAIYTAVNNAFGRGVQIRWIYNGTSSNTGLSLLNPSIPTLMSPTTSSYGIMHNKFVIIDARDPDPSKAFVWTGSTNMEDGQVNADYNNVVIFQDPHLAKAYTREFNQMWGGSGMIPDITLARFGPTKFENNIHLFRIGGRDVELYFSPIQNTDAHIQGAINTANSDLYFGVYAFTRDPIASSIKIKVQSGVYTAGIIDQFSVPYSADDTLNTVMGSMLKVYSLSNLYHNKYLIVDFSDTTSDPMVVTGSHNWTNAADTKNDENTVIIHDPFVVSQFYEAFYSDYAALGGQLGVSEWISDRGSVYPNPTKDVIYYKFPLRAKNIRLIDAMGKMVLEYKLENATGLLDLSEVSTGLYLLQWSDSTSTYAHRILVTH